ncbi:hypothetical protein H0H92_015917 [Tricholoma furcatifolium]|nr:hypothetical protein H0H92_015917 [Tricholoma furcatifolium]
MSFIVFPQDALDGIASGYILPCVQRLQISFDDSDAFLAAIQRRLEWETSRGPVKLKRIIGNADPDSKEKEIAVAEAIEVLEARYNIKIYVEWGRNPDVFIPSPS